MTDDESGFSHYDDEMSRRWDGIWFRTQGNEDEIRRHPQEFVRARDDPKALRDVRPKTFTARVSIGNPQVVSVSGGGAGLNVTLPRGAAQHLWQTGGALTSG